MKDSKELSKEEFIQMISLLKRHSDCQMDQWEAWKIESSKGTLFIDVLLSTTSPEENYDDLSKLLDEQK